MSQDDRSPEEDASYFASIWGLSEFQRKKLEDAFRTSRANAAKDAPVSPHPASGEGEPVLIKWLEREIGRLMQQAEHWAANGKPHAVHYRINKADSYFQIIAQLDHGGFAAMAAELEMPIGKPLGAYPPSPELARYREADFVVTTLHPQPSDNDRVAELERERDEAVATAKHNADCADFHDANALRNYRRAETAEAELHRLKSADHSTGNMVVGDDE